MHSLIVLSTFFDSVTDPVFTTNKIINSVNSSPKLNICIFENNNNMLASLSFFFCGIQVNEMTFHHRLGLRADASHGSTRLTLWPFSVWHYIGLAIQRYVVL